MAFFQRNKWVILALLVLSGLLITSRLYNILALPMFTDEAIYIRWSQIAKQDPSWRFISLTDGKQPLYVWITMVVMKFVKNPLLAGRLVSVAAGFGTMIGLFFLGHELFKNRKVGVISSLLYVLYPMAFVYDRMALYDGLVATCAVWALYFEVLLVRRIRLDIAYTLALVLGAGVLTKTIGFLSIYLSPLSLLLFEPGPRNGKKFFKWVLFIGFAAILAYGYYTILRLSPFFHIIGEKNTIFVYTFRQWLTHPLEFLGGNLAGQLDWVYSYMTGGLVSLVLLSFVLKPRFLREKLFLFLWFAIPFFALALFGRVLYPRFIFFMTVLLLPLAAFSIVSLVRTIPSRALLTFIYTASAIVLLYNDWYIVNDFKNANIAYPDLEQYSNNWPAGWGIREIISFLDNESKKGPIYVASDGTFGSLPTYAIEIYLDDNKNIRKRGIWPLPNQIPNDLIDKAKTIPVFFILNQLGSPPPEWPVELIAKYQKGIGNRFMRLYKVIPPIK